MKKLIVLYNLIIAKIIRYYYRKKKNTNEAIMFMPHSGVSKYDFVDLFNYRSDSAMTFAHFLLENRLCEEKEFILFVPSKEYIDRSYQLARELYPGKSFVFLSWDSLFIDYHKSDCIKNQLEFCRCFSRCSHVFVSLTYRLENYISNQVVVDLNYYSVAFKNDLLPTTNKNYMGLEKVGKKYSKMLLSSELSIRVMMPTMSFEREQYLDFGLCRNDNLLNDETFDELRKELLSSVSYQARKILLYIPTHRDYERNVNDVARSLFGYSLNFAKLDALLKEQGIIIICKVHPNQNRAAFSKELPESVKIHQAQHSYGLYELMKISDGMIGDYSSGYFDYLLLDKPVIFNFYDVDKYKEERGFTYNPIESIVAGDIVKTEDEFLSALCNLDDNAEKNRLKRSFVKDLFFTYQDANCCRRVYDYFIGNKV